MKTEIEQKETERTVVEKPSATRRSGERLTVLSGHVIEKLAEIPEGSVQCVVTSPPYWGLRSYLPKGHPSKHLEIGQEKKPDCGAWARTKIEDGRSKMDGCGECYVCTMLAVFGGKENPVGIWRVLREDGTVWLNLGDSYASTWSCSRVNAVGQGACDIGDRRIRTGNGIKEKDLIGIPWRVSLALQAAGWYLRSDIIWAKPNCMPESVTDRPTRSHEYLFLLTKSPRYFYDAEAIKEACSMRDDERPFGERANGDHNGQSGRMFKPEIRTPKSDKQRGHSRRHDGFNSRWDAMEKEEQCAGMRNKRDVWTISPANYPEAHFATFPPELIKPCILAGTSAGGACAQCGAPWDRVIFQGSDDREHQKACGGDRNGEYHGEAIKDYSANGVQNASDVKARILRGMKLRFTATFRPTCQCDGRGWQKLGSTRGIPRRLTRRNGWLRRLEKRFPKSIPCIVADPFGGSGTTGEVALSEGRRAILIELNPNYLPLIEQRTNVTPGLAI